MSFAVVPARIKYVGYGHAPTRESRCAFLAATPKGVAISRPTYTPTSNRTLQSTEAQNAETFFGLAMAPTLAPKDAAHIGIAIDGVATALMKKAADDKSNEKNTLYGSAAFGVGTPLTCENGELRRAKKINNAIGAPLEPVVAYYLQKNGPNTALVWIHKNANAWNPRLLNMFSNRRGQIVLPAQYDGTKQQSPSGKRPLQSEDDAAHQKQTSANIAEAQDLVDTIGTNPSAPTSGKKSSTKRRKKPRKEKSPTPDVSKDAGPVKNALAE